MVPADRPIAPWLTAAVIVGLAAIVGGGYWYCDSEYEEARAHAMEQLGSIASMKAREVQIWREDRLNDARELMESPFLASGVARYLADPQGEAAAAMSARLHSIQRQHALARAPSRRRRPNPTDPRWAGGRR